MEDTPPQKDFEPFRIKEKVGDMMKYGMPITYGFSRRNKELADEIRRSMLTMYRLTVKIEKKYFKKTTTQDLDEELAVLRHLIRMAADKDYSGPKYAPPLTRHQEEVWSRMNDEIGRMIGGYIKSLRSRSFSYQRERAKCSVAPIAVRTGTMAATLAFSTST